MIVVVALRTFYRIFLLEESKVGFAFERFKNITINDIQIKSTFEHRFQMRKVQADLKKLYQTISSEVKV